MGDTLEVTVASMPHAFVSEDASEIQIEFEGVDGQRVKLSFVSGKFQQYSSRAIQLLTHARNQIAATNGPLEIHAVEAVEVAADASIGGDKVLVSLLDDTGLPFHFALLADKADKLRESLYDAARSARIQASQPRN